MVFFDLLAHNPSLVQVPAGQVLFHEGDEGRLMYVLTIGQAEVRVGTQVVEQLVPGSIVGEMSIVLPGPRTATVLAQSDCEFVEVDEPRFQFLVKQNPEFALQVMRLLAERLKRMNQRLQQGSAG